MNRVSSGAVTDPFPYLKDAEGVSGLIRNYDWSQSSIGTPDTWPERLHSSISIALNAGFPIAIYWGPDFTLIYNDAWSSIPGDRHPWALGKAAHEVWPEIWADIQHQFTDALYKGVAFRASDTPLFMTRFGYTEETYFDYNLSPIKDTLGNIGGVFNTGIDTTYRVVNERRTKFLNRMAKGVNVPVSREESYLVIGEQMDTISIDIPFCCVFLFEGDEQNPSVVLSIGIDPETATNIPWPVDQLKKTGGSQVIHQFSKLLREPVMNYWPEPCEEAVLVPLKSSFGGTSGFIAAGVSARKRLDTDYRHFIESIGGYISTTIANGGIHEDEIVVRRQLLQREESLRKKIEEQLKLVTLVDNSVDLMSILELDGKNSYINPAGREMLGFDTHEQVLATPITHLHQPSDIAFVQSNVLPAVMNSGRWAGEMNVRHLKTGEVFPVHNSAVRIDDPVTNTPLAIGAVMRDLRPEIASRKALVESEQNLRNIIAHAPVAMCLLVGPEYVVEIANASMLELWGKPSETMINRPVFDGLPDAREQGLEQLLARVYNDGETIRAYERPIHLIRNGKSENLYLDFVYEPYRNAEGNVIGILAVAIDVTLQVSTRQKIEEIVKERTKQLEDANTYLVRINDELSRSNTNLSEFAYAASHDLKEPARKIHVFSDRLHQLLFNRMTPEEQHYFERMQMAAARMTSLITDLLTYSEVSLEVRKSDKVDLNELISQVLVDLDLEVEQSNASITIDTLPQINGNKRHLQQVFHNLLSNALKYKKPDVPPAIGIRSSIKQGNALPVVLSAEEKLAEFIVIEVSDNGVGFDRSDAERIFNVFTRLHVTPGFKGTGVGLSIVRKVVQNHNGYVWAESNIGAGSTFTIALPRANAL